MAAVIIHSDFGPQENKVFQSVFSFPIYMPWSDGARCMNLIFWMLTFKPAFSLPPFTLIKRPGLIKQELWELDAKKL